MDRGKVQFVLSTIQILQGIAILIAEEDRLDVCIAMTESHTAADKDCNPAY